MPEHARSSGRFAAALFDQQSEEHRVADWGGDELFTRMPRPRVVDDAPAPRFRPQLVLLDTPADHRPARREQPDVAGRARGEHASADGVRSRGEAAPAGPRSAVEAVRERAERLGIAVVPPHAADAIDEPAAALAPAADPAPTADALAEATQDAPHDHEWEPAAQEARHDHEWEPAPRVSRWDGDDWDLSGPRPKKVITGHPDALPPLPAVREERRRPQRTPAQLIGPRPERIMAWAFALGLLLILIAISTADAATL